MLHKGGVSGNINLSSWLEFAELAEPLWHDSNNFASKDFSLTFFFFGS